MSIASPLISDWISRGLKWKWTIQPTVRPFAITNGKTQIPQEKKDFTGSEGTLLYLLAVFNSPNGGISIESDPALNKGETETIANNLAIGNVLPNNLIYAIVPPTSPAGVFAIVMLKEWPWTETCKLFLVNGGQPAINCITYAYAIAYLTEPRPMSLETVEKLRFIYDLYPELQQTIKQTLMKEAKRLSLT